METRPEGDNKSPLEKSEKKKEDEYIDIFKYFESANIRNRDAFCELLDYTMENRNGPHK